MYVRKITAAATSVTDPMRMISGTDDKNWFKRTPSHARSNVSASYKLNRGQAVVAQQPIFVNKPKGCKVAQELSKLQCSCGSIRRSGGRACCIRTRRQALTMPSGTHDNEQPF